MHASKPFRWLLLPLVLVLVGLVFAARQPAAPNVLPDASGDVVGAAPRATVTSVAVAQSTSLPVGLAPQVQPLASLTAMPTIPVNELFPPTPTVEPMPTERSANAPIRVGIQVGHWKSSELPDELARLRTSTGTSAAGIKEADVNYDIAQRVAKLLQNVGIVVDVLPATIPPQYAADAFVAIHADGSPNTAMRGFKASTPWRASRASQQLLNTMELEYTSATNMPPGGEPTINMRGYYAFNGRRHEHAIAPTTPAIIVEMGFLTNSTDRRFMSNQADRVAVGIANGVVRYLNERDMNDRAALVPPNYATQQSISADGVDIRTAPRDNANVLLHANPDQQIVPLQEQGEWYQVVVRGQFNKIGWVRKDQVRQSTQPTATPPPATDS